MKRTLIIFGDDPMFDDFKGGLVHLKNSGVRRIIIRSILADNRSMEEELKKIDAVFLKFVLGFGFVFAAIAFFSLFAGCSKTKNNLPFAEISENIESAPNFYKFFYFSNDGYAPCENTADAPETLARPWTENFRVSDANTTESGDGLLLINKLGLLHFPKSGEFYLLRDINIFEEGTAENLVFSECEPFFTLYRNSFFSKDISESKDSFKNKPENRPYIVRASIENRTFYPVITYADLKIDEGEISGTFFDGEDWFSSVKISSRDATSFRYLFWKPTASLLSMKPFYHDGKISFKEIDPATYRNRLSLLDFSKSPDRLQALLQKISGALDFTVTLKNAGGVSPRLYSQGTDAKINANAILSPSWICCVFEDGTVFFNGALDGRENANNGNPYAFRLPKLGEGFFYTNFAISGNNLICGWEEKDFFKVGKSGFVVADLEKILY